MAKENSMFLGEYEYRVDSKGRLPLPPKFRQELGLEMILTKGVETCVIGYPLAEWHRVANGLTAKTIASESLRMLNRQMFSSAYPASLDGQGRTALPTKLRQHAQIEDTAIVVGANNYFEIWDPKLWEQAKTSAEEKAYQIIESLEGQQ
ncbi:MAG: division/cell wall cluster transcriptional repressor MraZ [Chloroflexi bacterium]|nr:division/cell wall cluster transcriptional repressor MraZ [Chloroflexota bacterium]